MSVPIPSPPPVAGFAGLHLAQFVAPDLGQPGISRYDPN